MTVIKEHPSIHETFPPKPNSTDRPRRTPLSPTLEITCIQFIILFLCNPIGFAQASEFVPPVHGATAVGVVASISMTSVQFATSVELVFATVSNFPLMILLA